MPAEQPLAARDPVPPTSIDVICCTALTGCGSGIVLGLDSEPSWVIHRLQLQTFGGGSVPAASQQDRASFIRWPVPNWLVYWTQPSSSRCLTKSNDNAQCIDSLAISVAYGTAGVGIWSAKQLRQRAVTAWGRAGRMAGRIVLVPALAFGCYIPAQRAGIASAQSSPASVARNTTDQRDIHAASDGSTRMPAAGELTRSEPFGVMDRQEPAGSIRHVRKHWWK